MSALLSGGEIINIHVGGSACNLASTFWQVIAKEHHLVTSHHVRKAARTSRQEEKRQYRDTENNLTNDTTTRHKRYNDTRQRQKSNFRHSDRQNDYSFHEGQHKANQRPLSSQNLSVFFQETLQRYVPRAIFVDLDPAARYSGLFEPLSPLKHFFRPENFIFGRETSSGIQPKAISLSERVLRLTHEALNRELEKSDYVQAIQLTHHIGGGTGSGIGVLIAQDIKDNFGTKIPLLSTTLLPTPADVSRQINSLEIYNAALSLPDIAAYSDLCFLFDNEALYDICLRLISIPNPGWRDINHIIASIFSNLSSCMRFPSTSNKYSTATRLQFKDLPSLLVPGNLSNIPFVIPGFCPFTNRASNAPLGALLAGNDVSSSDSSTDNHSDYAYCNRNVHQKYNKSQLHYRRAGTRMPSVNEMCQSLFKPSHLLASVDPLGHHYINSLAVFRGGLSPGDIEQELNYARLNGPPTYKEWSQWIPRRIHCKICPEPMPNLMLSAGWIGSTTAIGTLFENLTQTYEKLLTKKAFTHAYISAGMEENLFYESLELNKDLILKYENEFQQQHEDQILLYETKRDLRDIPFNWDVSQLPDMIYDTHKHIELSW